jgi:hypothetical protein
VIIPNPYKNVINLCILHLSVCTFYQSKGFICPLLSKIFSDKCLKIQTKAVFTLYGIVLAFPSELGVYSCSPVKSPKSFRVVILWLNNLHGLWR